MIGRRLYRLRPWLVRALIPPGHAGSYVLYVGSGAGVQPRYNGRSDHDLAARLTTHARAERGEYFSYHVHRDAATAYLAECTAFHLRGDAWANVIHPAAPRGAAAACPFCTVRGHIRRFSTHLIVSERLPATVTTKEA